LLLGLSQVKRELQASAQGEKALRVHIWNVLLASKWVVQIAATLGHKVAHIVEPAFWPIYYYAKELSQTI
jgi:hypothetical protein